MTQIKSKQHKNEKPEELSDTNAITNYYDDFVIC